MEAKTVNDGKEAVELHRCGANFDIIFMDKEMPIMDGHEVLLYHGTFIHVKVMCD